MSARPGDEAPEKTIGRLLSSLQYADEQNARHVEEIVRLSAKLDQQRKAINDYDRERHHEVMCLVLKGIYHRSYVPPVNEVGVVATARRVADLAYPPPSAAVCPDCVGSGEAWKLGAPGNNCPTCRGTGDCAAVSCRGEAVSREASDHWTLDLGRLESLLRDTDAEMGHRIEKLCERIAALEAEVAALKQPKAPFKFPVMCGMETGQTRNTTCYECGESKPWQEMSPPGFKCKACDLVRQHGWSNDGLGGVLCLYCRTPKTTANEHERCPYFT